MRVIRDTPEQLILSRIPWLTGLALTAFILIFVGGGLSMTDRAPLGGLFIVLFGAGVGLALFALSVVRVQLILDRAAGTLTLRRRSILGRDVTVRDLAQLREAVLEHRQSGHSHVRKGRTLYRATLILDDGAARLPVLLQYGNELPARRLVARINDWLQRPQAHRNQTSSAAL